MNIRSALFHSTIIISALISAVFGHELIHVLQFMFIYDEPLQDISIHFAQGYPVLTRCVVDKPIGSLQQTIDEIPAYAWTFWVIGLLIYNYTTIFYRKRNDSSNK